MTDSSEKTWTPPPGEVPKVHRLSTSREVRRLCARLIAQTWSGAIDAKTANAITYQLATVARIINDEQTLVLAKRVAAIEARVLGSAPTGPTLPARRLNA